MMTFISLRAWPTVINSTCTGKRNLWGWLNAVFNRVDDSRIKEVGPDRAAAEWLIRCGAAVKWKDTDKWQSDYNTLPTGNLSKYKIEEIDATDSAVMHIGFAHLNGLKYLKRIKFHRCYYLEDQALLKLYYVKDSLVSLEVTSCGNITDEGIISLQDLKKLRYLLLHNLPEVSNKENCLQVLKNALPVCELHYD